MSPASASNIRLYDTTLRDGTQREGLSLSVDDKVKIARALDRLGVHYIEGGWPGSNPKDAEFFRRIGADPPSSAKVAAFGSTRRAGVSCEEDGNLRALVEAGTTVVTLVGKTSILHVDRVLETTREENLRMIGESVAWLAQLGREVVYDAEHFFDGWRQDRAYALATLRAAEAAGAATVVLCDTNGGELPEVVADRVLELREHLTVPLGIHPHNDAGLAVANALAAVRAGCVQVQGTINGYGERCGNLDLVPLIANLQLKLGHRVVADEALARLSEVSHYVAEVANQHPDAHAPYVGRSAFAHKGGLHVAAIAKVPESYQHVEPERVGNTCRVVVSEVAGRRNVRLRAHELGLPPGEDEGAVLQRIKELEHRGFQFEAAEGSFEMLLRRQDPGYRPPFMVDDFTVIVEKRGGGGIGAQATVKLRVGDEVVHTAAEGDGPVNALDRAVRKALLPHYPALAEVHLVDYKVRIVDQHLGTAARPRVIIESARGTERWSTVGCSENIIEASWLALCDGIELALLRPAVGTSGARPAFLPYPAGQPHTPRVNELTHEV
jgi:2-isopropylmalate synthase